MERALRARHDLHLLRKAWHMTTGGVGLLLFLSLGASQHFIGMVLVGFSLAGFAFEFIRLRSRVINTLVLKTMGPLMRSSERESCSGLPFYALGVGASLLLFERDIAILSVLFLVFADPISSLFGILYGQHRLIPGKSLEGSIAGFVTCYLVTFMWLTQTQTITGPQVVGFCFLCGLVGAVSELLSFVADDNLTIPLLSGLGITLVNSLIPLMA